MTDTPPPPLPPSGWPAPGQYPDPPPVVGPAPYNGKAVGAFVCSLVGLVIAGIPLGIVSIALGATARAQIQQSGGRERGRGHALAAMILGIVDIILGIILITVVFG